MIAIITRYDFLIIRINDVVATTKNFRNLRDYYIIYMIHTSMFTTILSHILLSNHGVGLNTLLWVTMETFNFNLCCSQLLLYGFSNIESSAFDLLVLTEGVESITTNFNYNSKCHKVFDLKIIFIDTARWFEINL